MTALPVFGISKLHVLQLQRKIRPNHYVEGFGGVSPSMW